MREGKVIEFDGFVGDIESNGEKYMFLIDDVETDIQLNDFVSFRGEEVHGVKKAFFVKNVNKSMKFVKDEYNERWDN